MFNVIQSFRVLLLYIQKLLQYHTWYAHITYMYIIKPHICVQPYILKCSDYHLSQNMHHKIRSTLCLLIT